MYILVAVKPQRGKNPKNTAISMKTDGSRRGIHGKVMLAD